MDDSERLVTEFTEQIRQAWDKGNIPVPAAILESRQYIREVTPMVLRRESRTFSEMGRNPTDSECILIKALVRLAGSYDSNSIDVFNELDAEVFCNSKGGVIVEQSPFTGIVEEPDKRYVYKDGLLMRVETK